MADGSALAKPENIEAGAVEVQETIATADKHQFRYEVATL